MNIAQEDVPLHAMLLGLLVSLFLFQALADLGWLPGWAPASVTLAVMFSGFLSLTHRNPLRRPLVLCLLAAAVLLPLQNASPRQFDVAMGLAAMSGLGLVGFALLRRVLAPGRVSVARIEGAVALYLVIALVFATAYETLDGVAPGAFTQPSVAGDVGRFRYFSLVVQTSTGFGDIAPAIPLARTMVTLQAVMGQLFLAILLGRLVSLELEDRKRGDS